MGDDLDASLKTLAKGVGIMYIGTFLSKVLMYLYRIVVAREDIGLGPEAYGLISLGMAVFWIGVKVSRLGTGPGIIRFVTDYMGKDEEERIPTVMAAATSLAVPASLVMAGGMLVFAETIAVQIFDDAALTPIIQVFALAIPFQILYGTIESLVKAFRDMKYIAITDKIFRSVFTLVATVAVIYAGESMLGLERSQLVVGVAGAQLAAIALSFILIFWFAQRKVYPFMQRQFFNLRRERRDLFSYSWPLFLSGIVGLFVGWTDTFFLGFFDTARNVGIYNAALPTAQILAIVSSQMAVVLFPTVSEWYSRGQKETAEEIAAVAVKWMYMLSFPALLVMVAFRQQVLKILFGNTYTAGSIALAILATAYFTKTMTAHAGSFINSEEYTKLQFLNSVAVSTTNIVLNLVLIPYFQSAHPYGLGVTAAAAVATASALVVGGILATAEAYFLFGIQPYRVRMLLPPTAAAGLSAAAVYIALHLLFNPVPSWALIPGLAVFGGLYFVLFLLFGGISEHDIKILRAVDEKTDMNLEPAKRIMRKLMQ